jgi:hypothetical protein
MKLTIECEPSVFETLSNHYNHITPIMDRLAYSFDNYMTDILSEEAERIRAEYKDTP